MKFGLALYTLLFSSTVLASPGSRAMPKPCSNAAIIKNDVMREGRFQKDNSDGFEFALVDFSAMIQSDSVMLKWSVLGTIDHEYFEVQRSSNARNWKVVAQVKSGATGMYNDHYFETDEAPERGQAFYRLKQVSPDGNSKYSKTIAVYYRGRHRSKNVLPISASGTVLIKKKILSARGMDLYTEAGYRMVFKTSTLGDDTKLELGNVSTGVYILRIHRGIMPPSIIKLTKN